MHITRLRSCILLPSRAALITFTATAIIWLLAFTYCKYTYWRDPHSAFFSSEHVYERDYSIRRETAGLDFLDRLSASNATHLQNSSAQIIASPEICAAYVTVRRDMGMHEGEEKRQYINAALGSMLDTLSEEERAKLWVHVLFADVEEPGPEEHPLWNEEWLGRVVDDWGGYEFDEGMESMDQIEKMKWLARLMREREWQVKGVFDYIHTLRHCLHTTSAPYIAIFEDDIIFASDWLPRTLSALSHLSTSASPYLYLRLFYSETFLHWDESVDLVYAHLYLVLILSSLLTAVVLLFIRTFLLPFIRAPKTKTRIRTWMDNGMVMVLSIITVPAFVVLVFMLGKYNIPVRGWKLGGEGVVRMDRGGCCSQGLVFPRAVLVGGEKRGWEKEGEWEEMDKEVEREKGLIGWLEEKGTGQTDLLIEEWGDGTGLPRWALGKGVLQHVGIKSEFRLFHSLDHLGYI
ncbi:hypothetical protein ACMFMF_006293 [Clarireedia jacksonii]